MKNNYLLLALLMVNPALAQEPDVPVDLYCVDFKLKLQADKGDGNLYTEHYKEWDISIYADARDCGNYGCNGTIKNTLTGKSYSKYFDCFSKNDVGAICRLNQNYWNFVRSEDKNIYHSPQCNGTNIIIDKRQCNKCECVFIYPDSPNTATVKCKDFDENNMTCFTYTGYEDRYIGRYSNVAERYKNCVL